jgi:hypothetical protein
MIPQERFAYWWALWCERWNRNPPNGPTPAYTREFYRAVSCLEPDEWEAAAAAVFAGPGYFPSPADVLEKVRPADADLAGLKLEAAHQFEQVLTLASYGPHGATWRRGAIETNLGPLALKAFDLAGGQARFRTMTEADQHWVQREFVNAYVDQGKATDRAVLAQERLTAITTGRRPALGPAVRSPRLEHVSAALSLLPGGSTPNEEANGTDG